MGATNHTPRGLSQFLDNDKPTWRGDYNTDMQKIDRKFNSVGFDPADYGAIGDGVADDTAAIQAAIDAAKAAGGGRVILYERYGWRGDLIHRGGVTVDGVALRKVLVTPDNKDRGLVALDATARYRYGMWTEDSSDDNPGPLINLVIDGKNIGGATQLVLMESVDGVIDSCHFVNSAGDALEIGGSQNGTIDQCHIGESAGAAISVFHRVGQGAGNMKISNTYIATSRYLLTADQDPTNFWPHDIFFDKCLFENYTAGNDIVDLKAGDFQFRGCVFTYSLTGVHPPNDCLIYVRQPTNPTIGTRAVFDSCYYNGGTNGVTHLVRVKTDPGGYGNFVHFYGMQQVANCSYVACIDAGFSVVSYDGQLIKEGGTVNWWDAINGGILAAVNNHHYLPSRWSVPASATAKFIGDPIQIRNEADVTDRLRIDSNGVIRWLDGTDPNTAKASIARDTVSNVMHYGGAVEISNAFILRSFAFLIAAANTAVAISAAGSANPNYTIGFVAANSSAIVTIAADGQLGSQLQIQIAGGAIGETCSITWPANVKFAAEDPQPNNATKIVNLTWDGNNWVEVGRTHRLSQIDANRAPLVQETMPRELCVGESATVSGYVLLTYFTAFKDATITALKNYTGAVAAAATPTKCRMGLYTVAANGDLTLVASTPNDTSLWNAAYTAWSKNLSVAYAVKRGVRYAIGFFVVTAAAMPSWPYQNVSIMLSSQNPRLSGQLGGQADLPANIANGVIGNGTIRYYGELVGS